MDKNAAIIDIEGMTCGSCVKTIEGNVRVMPGVLSFNVHLQEKEASVLIDPTVVAMDEIVDKISNMGFEASLRKPLGDNSSEGHHSPDSASARGSTGHQADLASIFGGPRAGNIDRGKRSTTRKPKTAVAARVAPPEKASLGQFAVSGAAQGAVGASGKGVSAEGAGSGKEKKTTGQRRSPNTKPAYKGSPDLQPVVSSGEEFRLVVFDVETSGLTDFGEVIQLSAVCTSGDQFNSYIIPTRGKISYRAIQVHGIYQGKNGLFKGRKPLPAVAKKVAWEDFIRFCERRSPVILAGHNVNFDARFTLREVESVDLMEKFMGVVAGFCDTLPLLRNLLPQLDSHTQSSVVAEVMGDGFVYDAHNSEEDASSLLTVLKTLDISLETMIEYSFTALSFAQHQKNKGAEKEMQVLYSPRRVTRPNLANLASAGYNLRSLVEMAKHESREDFVETIRRADFSEKAAVNIYEALLGLESQH